MSLIVNSATYRKLVREDLDWLLTVPRTLERDHIQLILEQQIRDAAEIVERDSKRQRESGIHP